MSTSFSILCFLPQNWLLAGSRVELVSGLQQNNASFAMNKILEILTQQPIRIICLIKAAEDAD